MVPLSLILLLLPILVVLTALLTFLVVRWVDTQQGARQQSTAAQAALQGVIGRLSVLEGQLTHIGQAVMPISTAFQAILVKELTHFHTPAMDRLLEKLGPPYRLTEPEETELFRLLQERERDLDAEITASERDAAHIFPLLMRRVKREAEGLAGLPIQLRLVGVPLVGENPESSP